MSEENNMFENNDQKSETEQPQSYSQQPDPNQQQGYSQQPDPNQQQGYSQYYGEQNQQTPLSGYAEPVFHNQYAQNNAEESQGFGIASLICGILAIVTCCCSCLCAPLAIVSIVLGILQITKGTAKGMAIAGIICSAVGLVFMIICLMFTIFMNTSELSENYYRNYYDILQELEDMDYMENGHHSNSL